MILLAYSNPVPDKIRHQHIEHLLKLDISLDSAIAPDKLYLFLELLEVNIAAPAPCYEHPDCASVPLNGLVNFKSVTHQVKENEHQHGEKDHCDCWVHIRVVQACYECQNKDQANWLQRL